MDQASRSRWGNLTTHVASLVLLLGVALAMSERSSGFTADEGSYAIQAEALRGGSWAIDWPFRDADPDGSHFPYHAGILSSSQEFAYTNHPLWPSALAVVSWMLAEQIGLRLLSLFSVVVASVVAFRLAEHLGGGRSAPWAFWLVAASPLLANGLMLWAHAPAAATAGVACLAVARMIDRPTWSAFASLALCLTLGILLRSEFALFAFAVALVLSAVGFSRRDATLTVVGGASCALVFVVLRFEAWWVASITGDGGADPRLASRAVASGGWLIGRLEGAATSVFDGATDSRVAAVTTSLVIVCILVLVVSPRRLHLPIVPLVCVAVALTVVRFVVAPGDIAPGLIAAWPLGLLAFAGIAHAGPAERALLAVSGVYVLGVLATQYNDGGGAQWGGRLLALAIVPVAVTAALGAQEVRLRAPRVVLPLGVLLAAGGLAGLIVTDHVRSGNASAIATVAAAPSDAVVISNTQTARLDWARWPEHCWLYAMPDDLEEALEVLAEAGTEDATFVLYDIADLRRAGLDPSRVAEGVALARVGEGPGRCG